MDLDFGLTTTKVFLFAHFLLLPTPMFIFVWHGVAVSACWALRPNIQHDTDSGLAGWEEEGMMHEQDAGCSNAALAASLWGLDVVVNRKSLSR